MHPNGTVCHCFLCLHAVLSNSHWAEPNFPLLSAKSSDHVWGDQLLCFFGKWFEPRTISCLSSVIVRVRVVFRKIGVGDWRFNYLSGSHLWLESLSDEGIYASGRGFDCWGGSRILLEGRGAAHTWQDTRFLPVFAFLWAANIGVGWGRRLQPPNSPPAPSPSGSASGLVGFVVIRLVVKT